MPDSITSPFQRTFNQPLQVYEVVATPAARDSIPSGVRYEGMRTYVVSDGREYQLVGGVANVNWTTASLSGASGSFTTADSKTVTVVNGVITSIV